MQTFYKSEIFRTFSANHWNQSEIRALKTPSSFLGSASKIGSNFSSNAEKLRKFGSQDALNNLPESSRTIWSNGLSILFSIIPPCFNLSNSVR